MTTDKFQYMLENSGKIIDKIWYGINAAENVLR
jgi:hypothetical protein